MASGRRPKNRRWCLSCAEVTLAALAYLLSLSYFDVHSYILLVCHLGEEMRDFKTIAKLNMRPNEALKWIPAKMNLPKPEAIREGNWYVYRAETACDAI